MKLHELIIEAEAMLTVGKLRNAARHPGETITMRQHNLEAIEDAILGLPANKILYSKDIQDILNISNVDRDDFEILANAARSR